MKELGCANVGYTNNTPAVRDTFQVQNGPLSKRFCMNEGPKVVSSARNKRPLYSV